MRTAARETAPQRALRNCPREVGWKASILVILQKGNICIKHIFFPKVSASLMTVTASPREPTSSWRTLVLFCIWGDTRTGLIHHSPETILLSVDLFWQFLPEHGMPHSWSPPGTPFGGCWRSVVGSGSWFDPCRGRWQVPICRWQPSFAMCHVKPFQS